MDESGGGPTASSADDGDSRLTSRRRFWLAVSIVTAAAAFVVLGQLDGVLAGMHLPEDPPANMTSLTGGPIAFSSPSDHQKATTTWRNWDCFERVDPEACLTGREVPDDATRLHESPFTLARWFIGIDTLVFLPAYAFLLAIAIGTVRGFATLSGRVAAVLPWLLVIAAGADLVENVAGWFSVSNDGHQVAAWVTVVAARAKWWPLLVLLLALVVGFTASRRHERSYFRRLGRGLSLVRVPLTAVVLVVIVLAGPLLADQMADVVRRWDWVHVLVAVVLTLGIASFVWRTAWTVIRRVQRDVERFDGGDDSEMRIVLGQIFGVVVVCAGIVGLVLFVLGIERFRGLAVPAGVVLALSVLGLILGRRDPVAGPRANPSDRYLVGERLPRTLAAGAVTLVGLVVIRASIAEYVLDARRDLSAIVVVGGAVAIAVAAGLLVWGLRWLVMRDTDTGLVTTLVNAVLTAGLVVIAVGVAVHAPPAMRDALPDGLIVLAGFALVAAALVVYYLLDAVESDESRYAAMGLSVGDGDHASTSAPMEPPDSRAGEAGRRLSKVAHGLFVVLSLATIIWIYAAPLRAPNVLGGTGVVLLFVLVFSMLYRWMTLVAERTEVPRALERLGFRRTPMFLGLGLWLLIMVVFWQRPGFHDVSVIDRPPEATVDDPGPDHRTVVHPDIAQAFDAWVARTETSRPVDAVADGETDGARPAVPMVFVSAWGGGIRAAVWAAYAVDCAFEPHQTAEPCRSEPKSAFGSVFATSSISGGSLGLASYAAYVTDDGTESQEWVERRLSDDYVSGPLARLFFVDIPMGFLGGDASIDDRADTLAAAWQQSWPDIEGGLATGIRELWPKRADGEEAGGRWDALPLIVMNSTNVTDACTVNVSGAELAIETKVDGTEKWVDTCQSLAAFDADRLGPEDITDVRGEFVGTRDAVEYLCDGEDLSLAAAALMSARFPAISPSGRLTTGPNCADDDIVPAYATDGGQLELSGTLTAVQLWEAVEDRVVAFNAGDNPYCIAPLLIHLENGFSPDTAASADAQPNEWLDPLIFSLTSAKGGLVENIRQRAAFEFTGPIPGPGKELVVKLRSDGDAGDLKSVPRFAYIRTRAHPGASAPLGWTLSATTFDDLRAQLRQNATQFANVADWLGGDMVCVPVD